MNKTSLIEITLKDLKTLSISINVWIFVLLIVLTFIAIKVMKYLVNYAIISSIDIEEVELGIGGSKVKLKYNRKEKEIAYKLWVELNTRKLGLPYDEDYDVITEVYDSWYKAFEITRQLIKEIPANHIHRSSELIRITTRVLNVGLRPHLTRWQAKYRRWYNIALCAPENASLTPQEIQKKYPEYNALLEDLLITNKRLIKYKGIVEKMAFDK